MVESNGPEHSSSRTLNGKRNGNALKQTPLTNDHAPSHAPNNNNQEELCLEHSCLEHPCLEHSCLKRSPSPGPFSFQSLIGFSSHPKRKKSKHPRAYNIEAFWFMFLILSGGLSPEKQLLPSIIDRNGLTMNTQPTNVRTLFDPMVGEISVDTSPDVLDKLFNSNIRWRDENWRYLSENTRVNMLMTEQPPILSRITAPTNSNDRQASEPSIVDYDVIDYFWRRDIETEKGLTTVYPNYANNGQGCSTSSQACFDVSEQYERDLQLLREKSLFSSLTHEENYLYQNLSKAHYADFYSTVHPASVKGWQPTSNSSSTSGFSNNTERSMSPVKSISSFDENEAANFFSNLAKQSMLEERPTQPQQLHLYSNLTLCADQSTVLNNASMPQQNASIIWSYDDSFNWNIGETQSSSPLEEQPSQTEETVTDEILNGISDQPLEISDSEASEIWTIMQNSEDLGDAVELHEFIGMEMLGEFSHLGNESRLNSPIPENVLTYVERDTSPSSGIGSMQSSSPSPNHTEDLGFSENDENSYRFYNKLAPKVRCTQSSPADSSVESFKRPSFYRRQEKLHEDVILERHSASQRKRGRQSKDEQLARNNHLPASAEAFVSMSHIEIQRYMRDPVLTSQQKALIKKIRRRGRNKIAARKCRERRTFSACR